MSVLHIYAQECWHDEAYIGGTREELTRLCQAIERALADGKSTMDSFTSDGEGYRVHIVSVTHEDADRMARPYTDEPAREPVTDSTFGPWSIVFANT